jgi:hypothetical protein
MEVTDNKLLSLHSVRCIFHTFNSDESKALEEKRTRYSSFNLDVIDIVKKLFTDEFDGDFYIYPAHSMFLAKALRGIHNNAMKAIYDKIGRPDLIAFDRKHFIFIEIKLYGDRIGVDQIRWTLKHPDCPTVFCFLRGNKVTGTWRRKSTKSQR